MIAFGGRPFLEYLVEQLAEQGIRRIVLLLGYLPDAIRDHFGDGRAFGVRIDYDVTPADDLTAARILHARDRLDERFLLLYCDNYWPLDLDRHWQRYLAIGAPAMVTVYRNGDGWSNGHNMAIGPDGLVTAFDRSRSSSGLEGVEIGYAILERQLLDRLPGPDVLLEAGLYPGLIASRELAAFPTDHRYYSVGSLERLGPTAAFLAREPTILLDRDGVLNRRPARATYVTRPDEFAWLPGAREALRQLAAADYRILVASNQPGVARGAMSEADLRAVEARARREAEAAGGRIDAFYDCLHDWDAGCACRKPRPGLLHQAQRDHALDLSRTPFVGDDERDGQAADAAGCPFHLVTEGRSLLDVTADLLGSGDSAWRLGAPGPRASAAIGAGRP